MELTIAATVAYEKKLLMASFIAFCLLFTANLIYFYCLRNIIQNEANWLIIRYPLYIKCPRF